MGNDQSTVIEEERKMLESLYQISEGRLDNADHTHVNSRVNAGTSAPNCQPSHTVQEIEEEKKRKEEEERKRIIDEVKEAERLAGLLDINDSQHREYIDAQKKMERLNSESSNASGRSQPDKGSIGSYVQMAKTGYQELVNAIIRWVDILLLLLFCVGTVMGCVDTGVIIFLRGKTYIASKDNHQ